MANTVGLGISVAVLDGVGLTVAVANAVAEAVGVAVGMAVVIIGPTTWVGVARVGLRVAVAVAGMNVAVGVIAATA